MYKPYAEQLVREGKAYRCFCTKERLEALKENAPEGTGYDRHCRDLSEEEIQYYITHAHPLDKAGAYGIQEWIGYIGIRAIEGSYFNVVGFPTHRFYQELKAFSAGR